MRVLLRLSLLMTALVVGATVLAGILTPERSRDLPGSTPESRANSGSATRDQSFAAAVASVDEAFRQAWRESEYSRAEPADPAEPLTVARRLSLALVGTTPSLEEVRRFESWSEGERIDRYVDALLADRRTADYLAERFARALAGDEDGPFLVYRRRRFVNWIADTLQESSRYDRLIRQVITARGLWTDNPQVNFITATVTEATGQPDPEMLAVRVSRVMLGVRLDCAQCHDHPFDERWKQSDFQSLAAYFSGAGFGEDGKALRGVSDLAAAYTVEDRETGAASQVEPCPPFGGEWIEASEDRPARRQLADWVTHQDNRAFARATVNRFWALMVGEPLVEPIDDIPLSDSQDGGDVHAALDALASDFAASGYDWRRLVRVIASSEFYRLDSRSTKSQAAFPITRLRSEQVAGAIAQSTRLATIDSDSHILTQLARFAGQNDFLKRYGDAGSQEMELAEGSLTQRLLLMNGEIVHEQTKPNLVTNAATRIAALAPDDATAIEAAYLATLTRRPTDAERKHFFVELAGTKGEQRQRRLADLYWALINSTEFSWNH